ncbi:MAG: HD domain-containing phosphohydrolase [Candidatus Omnitrophota bacterium]
MAKNGTAENMIQVIGNSANFKNQMRAIERLFNGCGWILAAGPDDFRRGDAQNSCKSCARAGAGCRAAMIEAMGKCAQTRKVQRFECGGGASGVAYPFVQGKKVYGYLIMCRIANTPSDDMVNMIAAVMETLLCDSQKEMELKKLYDTIRPRAIALSTVHTLHRLISSTLDMNELLPRVARLTLQVMRASRCSIKLVDSKRKILLPKTTIDLKSKKTKLKKVRIGKWAPGKAVKYMRPIRGKDYLATPLIDEDVIGVITVYDKADDKPFTDFDEEIMKTLCEQAVIAIRNAQLYKEQERLTMGSIKTIAAILETKSPGSFVPKGSFMRLVKLVGQELKMSEYELKCLQYATILHDAGQITLPDRLTRKKGVLTGDEYDMIKEHPKKAAIILRPLRSLKDVVPIILHHHENYDGTGYPNGQKGDEIPLGARIMGVIGAFEAMITERPYRKRAGINEAIDEISKNSGRQFDPLVVRAFMSVVRRKDVMKMLEKEKHGFKRTGR